MLISYDEAKRQTNLRKHGIDLAECAPIFDAEMFTLEDTSENYGEKRLYSLGWLHGDVVALIWTERHNTARLISCRKATRHESQKYLHHAYGF
ncbi:MAG: BrnT family toxin [Ottowia sp.]|nr:BrnT family toxin [Ottowia sp.]MBQ6656789.1 BrnT family toxin [Ottowia sp.]MBQ9579107.1 BrnT family toxin [Ottowia sp.]